MGAEVTNNATDPYNMTTSSIKSVIQFLLNRIDRIEELNRERNLNLEIQSRNIDMGYSIQKEYLKVFGTENPVIMTFNKDHKLYAEAFEEMVKIEFDRKIQDGEATKDDFIFGKNPTSRNGETVFVMNQNAFEIAKEIQKDYLVRQQGYYAEVSLKSFCKANVGETARNIIRLEGITENELIAFRKKGWLSKDSITFTDILEKDGKFTILFNTNDLGYKAISEDKLDDKKECMLTELIKMEAYISGRSGIENTASDKYDIEMEYRALKPKEGDDLYFVSSLGDSKVLHVTDSGFILSEIDTKLGMPQLKTLCRANIGDTNYEAKLLQSLEKVKNPCLVEKEKVMQLCVSKKSIERIGEDGKKILMSPSIIAENTVRAQVIDVLTKEAYAQYTKEKYNNYKEAGVYFNIDDFKNVIEKTKQIANQLLNEEKSILPFRTRENPVIPNVSKEYLESLNLNGISNETIDSLGKIWEENKDSFFFMDLKNEVIQACDKANEKVLENILLDKATAEIYLANVNTDEKSLKHENMLHNYEDRDTRTIVDIVQVSLEDGDVAEIDNSNDFGDREFV